ncbi:MAG: O-antigen ligase family protein [Candidatus Scalindua sp.]
MGLVSWICTVIENVIWICTIIEIIFWICAICVVLIIAGVIFYKPYLGVVFVIVSIPFEGVIDFGCISIYPLETILAILGLICIYKSIVERYNCFGNMKLVYCCIPFVLCIMLSVTKSIELSLTVKEIVRWLELFVIYYLTINLINDDKKMRMILYSIFLTVGMVSILGIINYYNSVGYIFFGHRASSFFGNPNPFAGYVALIIPVLFGMLMASVSLWERITLGIVTVLSIAAWFLTFSRASLISLTLTMILLFFLAKAKKKVPLLLVILFAIFAVTFIFSDVRDGFIDRFRPIFMHRVLEHRAMCYSVGFDMVKDDIILGIGIGNYPLLITKFTKNVSLIQTHLHSLYLQIFVETGIMGLSAFVFWLVCIVKYLVSSLKALEKTGNYSLFVGLVGGVIVYLFNNLSEVLTVHGIHLQWGIILGLAVVLTQLRESEG